MTTNTKDASRFFLILTAFFGLYVRLFPLFKTNFPLVDGGMFYTMIRDLQASHFILPAFTTYNQAEIPFAYPPLAFYVAGTLNSIMHIPLIDIIKWQPVLFSILTIPLFHCFAKQILDSESKAALATLIFTLTPNSYWWDIVGGGLTRSMGTLFFIAAGLSAHQMYQTKKPAWIICTILAGSFAVLTHLSWALQSVVFVFILWLFWGRNKEGITSSSIVVMGILLLTSPWWVNILQRHGLNPFLLAGQVTSSRWLFWTIPFTLSFTGEYTTVIAVLGLIGFFIQLARKNHFFPLWALASLIVDPRGGIPASIFPFTFLAVSAITDAIAPQLNRVKTNSEDIDTWTDSLNSSAGRLFFGFFIILFLYNAFNISNTLSYQVLGPEEFNAINWIRSNTDAMDTFLILVEQENPLLSPFTEWFPALAKRRSIATIQGTEWLSGDRHYNKQLSIITDIHRCLYEDVGCLYDLQAKMTSTYDFIMVSSKTAVPLLHSLENQPGIKLEYSSLTIKIFKMTTGKSNNFR